MQIIFPLKDFSFSIFPDLKKFSDNIDSNVETIKDFLASFYTFGPFVPDVTIQDGIVTIDINTENIDKYYDEYQKAVNLCEQSKFSEAKPILKKLIKQNPSISEFHRVYGQIMEVEGNIDEAKNYLIDALRWNPKNKYALIMLGNIFARHDDDIESANKFFNEVLSLDPDDYIALNNIGANLAKLEKYDDAEKYLNVALSINDSYSNTHYALGLINEHKGNYLESFNFAVQAMKLSINKEKNIYESSHSMASSSAYKYITDDKKIKDTIALFLQKIQSEGGVKIKVEESKEIDFPAKTLYAENYNRDYHLILFKPDFPSFPHLIMHELSHIDFANKAKNSSKYKIFTTNNSHREQFIKNCEKHIFALNKSGISEKNITSFVNSLFNGLSSQIYNSPVDLFIEDFLYNEFPENRPYQYFALQFFQKSYIDGLKHKDVIKYSPKFLRDANAVYNLIHAAQLTELYGYDMSRSYPDLILYKTITAKLYKQYLEVKNNFQPGDEYALIDKWGKELRLNKYYELKFQNAPNNTPDNINDILKQIEKDPLNFEPSNREDSLKRVSFKDNPAGSMAVTMYCLDALQHFDGKESDYIQEVTFEIAMLGTYGLNPYNNEKKYSLKNIPGKEFTALHLLSYEYVGFQIINPELDTQLDFQNEYESAKQMFNK